MRPGIALALPHLGDCQQTPCLSGSLGLNLNGTPVESASSLVPVRWVRIYRVPRTVPGIYINKENLVQNDLSRLSQFALPVILFHLLKPLRWGGGLSPYFGDGKSTRRPWVHFLSAGGWLLDGKLRTGLRRGRNCIRVEGPRLSLHSPVLSLALGARFPGTR